MRNWFAAVLFTFFLLPAIPTEALSAPADTESKFGVYLLGGGGLNLHSKSISCSGYGRSEMLGARFGYAPWKHFEIQAEYSELPGFDNGELYRAPGNSDHVLRW